jgi:hypothetical protein
MYVNILDEILLGANSYKTDVLVGHETGDENKYCHYCRTFD